MLSGRLVDGKTIVLTVANIFSHFTTVRKFNFQWFSPPIVRIVPCSILSNTDVEQRGSYLEAGMVQYRVFLATLVALHFTPVSE